MQYFPVGAMISGDEHSSRLYPKNPTTVSQDAVAEINNVLKAVPLRDLVEAAISLSPDGVPDGRTLEDKIPLRLTGISPDADFRLQWLPAGPVYASDPNGPSHGDQLHVRIIRKS